MKWYQTSLSRQGQTWQVTHIPSRQRNRAPFLLSQILVKSSLLPWRDAKTTITPDRGRHLLRASQLFSALQSLQWVGHIHRQKAQCLWEIEVRRDVALCLKAPQYVISPAGDRSFSLAFNEDRASFMANHTQAPAARGHRRATLPWHRLRTSTGESWHSRFWKPLFKLTGSNHSQLVIMKLQERILLEVASSSSGGNVARKVNFLLNPVSWAS